MKTIIAGSRDITDYDYVEKAIKESGFNITEVVCRGARGVDTLGASWANTYGVPVKYFPANWDKYGRGAGPIRNKEMALYADALIALWDGISKGTGDMIQQARLVNLNRFVKIGDISFWITVKQSNVP